MEEANGAQSTNTVVLFDEWSRCLGSKYQWDKVYRYGRFDGCEAQWRDLKIAAKAKFMRDPAEVEKLMRTTHYRQHLGSDAKASPTAGVIWELKDKPGWD